MTASDNGSNQASLEDGYFDSYVRHAEVFRNWVGAYAVGCLAILISQTSMLDKLRAGNKLSYVAACFLLAAALEIVLVYLNKVSQWILYAAEREGGDDAKTGFWYKASDWFSESYWIDAVFDLGALVLLGRGTYLLLVYLS
jgi:hypothetical protein